jgi:RNA polymerase sigma-70 factor, ECF subfamily
MSPTPFYQFDAEYIQALRLGDEQTVEHFYKYFSVLLRHWLRKRCFSVAMVEDIQQETFVRVLRVVRKPGAIERPERFGAFVMSVCANVRLEFLRKERAAVSDQRTDHTPSPETLAARAELLKYVHRALVKLSDNDRKAVAMTLLEDKSHEEAARELNVERACFRVILHRARARFRSQLGQVLNMPQETVLDAARFAPFRGWAVSQSCSQD